MNILTETFESIDPRSNDTRGCDGGVRKELAKGIDVTRSATRCGARYDRHGNRSPGSRHFERLERSRGVFACASCPSSSPLRTAVIKMLMTRGILSNDPIAIPFLPVCNIRAASSNFGRRDIPGTRWRAHPSRHSWCLCPGMVGDGARHRSNRRNRPVDQPDPAAVDSWQQDSVKCLRVIRSLNQTGGEPQ
jgi:hypothetical protein